MKILTAFTYEVDDADYAVEEILQQLGLEENRKRHAAGIITCHPDFMETGVAHAVAERLPFEVIGCTTIGTMTQGEHDVLMLGITVFTSDENQFAALWAVPGEDEYHAALSASYREKTAGMEGTPSLIMPLFPLMTYRGGEELIAATERVVGKAPMFGTIAFDHAKDGSKCTVFCKGNESEPEGIAMLLVYGPVNAKFHVIPLPQAKIQTQRAVITKSKGSLLMEVNNLTAQTYMESIGMQSDSFGDGNLSVPVIVNFGDGTPPVARGVHTFTEEGYAVCGAAMPEHATIAIGMLDEEDILETARQVCETAMQAKDGAGLILIPCGSRYLQMVNTSYTEMDRVRDTLDGSPLPYYLFYSGGEICPVYEPGGATVNRYHAFTLTAMLLS